MKAVGYVRVSSRQQLDGYGLDAQERDVRSYARRNKLRLVEMFREEGVSGTVPATQRPALMEALQLLTAGNADVLVVPTLDRLARELAVQEAALALLWNARKAVHTVEDGEVREDDPDDPMRKAMRKMRGVFAELEKDTVVLRLRKGKREKRAQGGYVGGPAPFGWRADGGRLVPQPREQVHIEWMRNRQKDGAGIRAISRELNEAGVPSKTGGTWHPTQVGRILARAG